jgi:hypothetical protein
LGAISSGLQVFEKKSRYLGLLLIHTGYRYLYGGFGFPPNTPGYANTSGYNDLYILTIPTFQWIRYGYPSDSNITGKHPKGITTYNIIENAQILVIGGQYTNDTFRYDYPI